MISRKTGCLCNTPTFSSKSPSRLNSRYNHLQEQRTGFVLGNGSQNVSTTSNSIQSIPPIGKRKRKTTRWGPTLTKHMPASIFTDNESSNKRRHDGTATFNRQHSHHAIIYDDDSGPKTPPRDIVDCDDGTIESTSTTSRCVGSGIPMMNLFNQQPLASTAALIIV